jgi:folate-dependent tRNA-U54 methylase TrmFO/GidA
MHVNYGLMPSLVPPVRGNQERYDAYARRAADALDGWIRARDDLAVPQLRQGLQDALRRGGA